MAGLEETTTGMLQKQFEIIKFLGKGSYGSVYKVRRLSDGLFYAIKEMNVKSMSQEEKMDAVNEIRLLASVKHDNVIQYHEAFIDGPKLCIVMEFAESGDLAGCIKARQQQRKHFPEEQIWSYFIQICRGLQALHAARILHRDIKTANIMRPDSNRVKIGDLGVAKVLKGQMTKTQIGTPHYMPPEVWKNKPYNFSSDMWALGCTLYELATFNVPFEARSMSELRYKVIRGQYPPIPTVYSRDVSDMIRELLNPDQATRLSAEQVLNMPSVRARLALAPPVSTAEKPAGTPMLATIQVPQNLRLLKAKLPRPSYPNTPLPGGNTPGYAVSAQAAINRQYEGNRLPAIASGRLFNQAGGAARGAQPQVLKNVPSQRYQNANAHAPSAAGARKPSEFAGQQKQLPPIPGGRPPANAYANSPYAQPVTRNLYKKAPSQNGRAAGPIPGGYSPYGGGRAPAAAAVIGASPLGPKAAPQYGGVPNGRYAQGVGSRQTGAGRPPLGNNRGRYY